MDINKILNADILDLIFEGRFKEYGAYELRKTYNDRLKKALIGMVTVTVLLAGAAIWSNSDKKSKTEIIVTDVSLTDVTQEKKPPPPPPPPPPKVEPPKVEMAKFTPPKIVKDEEVKKEDEVKEVEKLEDVKIGAIDQKGIKDDGLVAPTESAVAPPAEEETDKIFTVVQIPAEFPGGTQGWIRYLERTLNRDLPVENGAPAGKYSVVVSFVVARDGSISDVKSENDPGYGTKDEAVRVITRGPKWKPAVQNGRNVIYRHRQAIVFVVSED
jgi:periplasmic protein TonB